MVTSSCSLTLSLTNLWETHRHSGYLSVDGGLRMFKQAGHPTKVTSGIDLVYTEVTREIFWGKHTPQVEETRLLLSAVISMGLTQAWDHCYCGNSQRHLRSNKQDKQFWFSSLSCNYWTLPTDIFCWNELENLPLSEKCLNLARIISITVCDEGLNSIKSDCQSNVSV